jgi:hypothetical protein
MEYLIVTIERRHFETQTINLSGEELSLLEENGTYSLGELTLGRRISAGF